MLMLWSMYQYYCWADAIWPVNCFSSIGDIVLSVVVTLQFVKPKAIAVDKCTAIPVFIYIFGSYLEQFTQVLFPRLVDNSKDSGNAFSDKSAERQHLDYLEQCYKNAILKFCKSFGSHFRQFRSLSSGYFGDAQRRKFLLEVMKLLLQFFLRLSMKFTCLYFCLEQKHIEYYCHENDQQRTQTTLD